MIKDSNELFLKFRDQLLMDARLWGDVKFMSVIERHSSRINLILSAIAKVIYKEFIENA